ncbi:MAG: gamma-glutamyltransferase, partial [Pseudomonadales bacterium]|nr:gamma-glutamyltransferase [Pseudomonadales bacterium]
MGSRITLKDLQAYEAKVSAGLVGQYKGAAIHTAGPLTAGPSLLLALEELATAGAGAEPDARYFEKIAEALHKSYRHRLQVLGEGQLTDSNTTHICVADSEGNVVSHTQTIMSAFGSRIMLPESGVLMNNGMMWFDPRPGGPNSVVGGRHPLCNMSPTLVVRDDSVTALGACGGRKIFPAVFQLISLLEDFGLSVDDAVHHPRIDVSGTEMVTIMDSMPEAVIAVLQDRFPETRVRVNGVSP